LREREGLMDRGKREREKDGRREGERDEVNREKGGER
jgi:hypothetical protein